MSRAVIDTRSLSESALLEAARRVYRREDPTSFWHPEDQMIALDMVRRSVIEYVTAASKRSRLAHL